MKVKQTPNFSDSDGVFEEFVRDQESYFTPPLVLAGDAWDPADRGTPFDCIFSGHRPHAANESTWPEIRSLPRESPFIPAIQDVGVQVSLQLQLCGSPATGIFSVTPFLQMLMNDSAVLASDG